jgi:hypothetical protein
LTGTEGMSRRAARAALLGR